VFDFRHPNAEYVWLRTSIAIDCKWSQISDHFHNRSGGRNPANSSSRLLSIMFLNYQRERSTCFCFLLDDFSQSPAWCYASACSPGSHPHADRPNWKPGKTFDDYIANCSEGLEIYSDRHAANLLGVSRIELYRWKLAATLPEELVDRLFEARAIIKARNNSPRSPNGSMRRRRHHGWQHSRGGMLPPLRRPAAETPTGQRKGHGDRHALAARTGAKACFNSVKRPRQDFRVA
jgi:hypothetical protein